MFSTTQPLTIGFDIGGTNLRGGVVDAAGTLIDSLSTRTPRDAQEAEDAVVGIVEKLRSRYEVNAVGLAVAAFLDPECEYVRFAPHLPWRDAPLRSSLAERLGLPVTVEHDANSAAWGEYRFGAGRDAKIWVFFAVGTGIGATLMINGEIYRGSFGVAPEFGHLTVVAGPEGRQCECGKTGCLERYASGTALVDTARELANSCNGAQLERDLLTGMDVTGADVVRAAREGDRLGIAVLEDFARWLGLGLATVADVLDPALIVLGGGVSGDADLFLPTTRASMDAAMVGAGHRPSPRLAVAELGGDAGMIGVADLARARAFPHER